MENRQEEETFNERYEELLNQDADFQQQLDNEEKYWAELQEEAYREEEAWRDAQDVEEEMKR